MSWIHVRLVLSSNQHARFSKGVSLQWLSFNTKAESMFWGKVVLLLCYMASWLASHINWLVSLPFIGIILRGWICKDTRKYSQRIYPCEDIKLKPLLCQRNLCCAGTLIIPRQCFGNNLINAYIITCKFSKDLFKRKLCKLKSIVAEAHFTKFYTSPASWTLTC